MKNYLKLFYILVLAGAGVFLFGAHSARAAEIYNFSSGTSTLHATGGAVFNPLTVPASGSLPSATGNLQTIGVEINNLDTTTTCGTGSCSIVIEASGNTGPACTSDSVSVLNGQSGYVNFPFTNCGIEFATTTALNLVGPLTSSFSSFVAGDYMYDSPSGNFNLNIWNSPIPSDSFTSPGNTGTTNDVPSFTNINFGGQCVTNGTNNYALTFAFSDGQIANTTSASGTPTYTGPFTISCNSGTWSTSIGVSNDTVAAILIPPGQGANPTAWVQVFLRASESGSTVNFLSFDPVITKSPETNDFNNWLLNFQLDPNNTATSTQVCVDYGPSTSTPFLYQDCGSIFNPQNNKDISGNPFGSQNVTKNTALGLGNYKAIGYLTDTNSMATYASTTEFDFAVVFDASTSPPTSYPNGGTPQGSSANNTTAALAINCNQGNVIVSGLCDVLVYLGVPSQSALNSFSSLWPQISSKPPFGWFTVSENSLSELNTSTPASSTPQDLTLISDFTTPVDFGLAFLVGLSFIIFIINRLRNMSLLG